MKKKIDNPGNRPEVLWIKNPLRLPKNVVPPLRFSWLCNRNVTKESFAGITALARKALIRNNAEKGWLLETSNGAFYVYYKRGSNEKKGEK